ncbi:MAG: tRNA pseudouridine(55) synthase TruB [Rhodobacteraceae bacterium]|nr:tRNA pseudouridine(55) synthase TruB [Paracoccaceae bacterium]
MARRRKGRDISGWVIVDKPAGVGSTDVVSKVRWAFEAKKAGHAGTLDPSATGLLAVALGEATKTIPFITDALKSYSFDVRFGMSTTTDDAEGEVLETSEKRPGDAEIIAALPQFRGQIKQRPPQFSAVKVDGQRAYDLAREGEAMDLAERDLWVDQLDLIERLDEDSARFELVCGKGGYVRSIARDLGSDLGCHAHVLTLRRVWSGPFDLTGLHMTWDQIEELARTPEIDAYLLPLEAGLADVPELKCTDLAATRLRNGNPAQVLTSAEFGETAWASHDGLAVAIGTYRAGQLHPSRVIVR